MLAASGFLRALAVSDGETSASLNALLFLGKEAVSRLRSREETPSVLVEDVDGVRPLSQEAWLGFVAGGGAAKGPVSPEDLERRDFAARFFRGLVEPSREASELLAGLARREEVEVRSDSADGKRAEPFEEGIVAGFGKDEGEAERKKSQGERASLGSLDVSFDALEASHTSVAVRFQSVDEVNPLGVRHDFPLPEFPQVHHPDPAQVQEQFLAFAKGMLSYLYFSKASAEAMKTPGRSLEERRVTVEAQS